MIIELYRAKTLENQVRLFWEQGDFGYIKKMKRQVLDLCQPNEPVLNDVDRYTCTCNKYDICSLSLKEKKLYLTSMQAYTLGEEYTFMWTGELHLDWCADNKNNINEAVIYMYTDVHMTDFNINTFSPFWSLYTCIDFR